MGLQVQETDGCLTVQTGFPVAAVLLWTSTAVILAMVVVETFSGTTPYRIVGGTMAIFFMAFIAWLFGESSRFAFSRSENQFSWTYRRLFLKRHGHIPLANVKRARRQEYYDDGLSKYRLLVETTQEPVPLTEAYIAHGRYDEELLETVDRINIYLSTENGEYLQRRT